MSATATTAMERLNRVEELFHEALALEPNARPRFLAAACASEPGLRSEVEALIAAHERPGSFIDTPAYLAFDSLDDELSDSLIGTALGRYQVVRLIKKSGMGEVFLARDTHLPRDVALKLLPLVFTGDESRLRRFILEAEAVSSLNHPNIITIHEIGHIEDIHFIATEFVDGHTLREKLSDGPLAVSEAVDFAIGVTSALVASHAAGIIHRDIKPENIMIRRDGYLKVLDFGLAKLAERPDMKVDKRSSGISMLETDPGTLMGTIGYLSPEQAKALEVDARSDFFSLGVVLYEMIAGHAPFQGDSAHDVIGAILNTDPPPLTNFAPDTPVALQQIVDRALSKDKEKRYQQAEELLTDLKAVKSQLEQPQTGIPRGIEPGSFTSRFHKLPRWQVLLAVVVIVSALAVGANFIRHRLQRENNLASAPGVVAGAEVTRSLAVLPFKTASWNATFGRYNGGEHEQLTNAVVEKLGATGKIDVASQDALLAEKATPHNILLVGHKLNVDAVLTGAVFRNDAELIRLRLHLISVRGGEVLWADTVVASPKDLPGLADFITRNVRAGLQRLRSAEEYERRATRHTSNRDAYQHYLQGRFIWEQRDDVFVPNSVDHAEGIVTSLNQLEQARALDPNFALPYLGLADHYKITDYKGGEWRKGEEYALKALELDPNLAAARATLAFIRMFHYWDWAGAEAEFKRALELDADCLTAHQWYALFHALRGNYNESTKEITRARELAPFSLNVAATAAKMFYFDAGSSPTRTYSTAIYQSIRILDLHSEASEAQIILTHAYWMHDEENDREKAVAVATNGTWKSSPQDYASKWAGPRIGSREFDNIRRADLYNRAVWSAVLDRREEALDLLERAYNEHHFFVIYIKAEPFFTNLRDEPRYLDLLRRLGLS